MSLDSFCLFHSPYFTPCFSTGYATSTNTTHVTDTVADMKKLLFIAFLLPSIALADVTASGFGTSVVNQCYVTAGTCDGYDTFQGTASTTMYVIYTGGYYRIKTFLDCTNSESDHVIYYGLGTDPTTTSWTAFGGGLIPGVAPTGSFVAGACAVAPTPSWLSLVRSFWIW